MATPNVNYWYLWSTLTTFGIGNIIMHYKAFDTNCFYGYNEYELLLQEVNGHSHVILSIYFILLLLLS